MQHVASEKSLSKCRWSFKTKKRHYLHSAYHARITRRQYSLKDICKELEVGIWR